MPVDRTIDLAVSRPRQLPSTETLEEEHELVPVEPFENKIGKVETAINEFQLTITELEDAQKANIYLTDTLDPSYQQTKQNVMTLTQRCIGLSQEIRGSLQVIDRETRSAAPSLPENVLRMRVYRYQNSVRKFMEALIRFRNLQESYTQNVRSRMERQYRIYVDPSATTEDINRALDEYGGELPVERMAVVGASPLQTRIAAKEVHDRYDQLFSVQQSLMELGDLYSDMTLLLQSQDNVLQTIQVQAERTQAELETGSKEVTRATRIARKVRRRKWIVTILVILVLGGIAAAIAIPIAVKGG